MGLAEIQPILARLYTDADFREAFFADPTATAHTLGLSASDSDQLTALSAAQVGHFADSLIGKRRGEVRKLLPLTCRALGPAFASLFRRHAAAYLPTGARRHRTDAFAFAAYLVGLTANPAPKSEEPPPWLGDLARFEAAWLIVADPSCRWHCARFSCDIAHLAAKLQTEQEPDILPGSRLLIWFRLRPNGRLYHRALPWPGRWR